MEWPSQENQPWLGLFLYEIGLKTFRDGGGSCGWHCYNSHISRLLYKLLVKEQRKRWSHPFCMCNNHGQWQNSDNTEFWGGFWSIPTVAGQGGMAHWLYFLCPCRLDHASLLFDRLSGPVQRNVLSPWGHRGSQRYTVKLGLEARQCESRIHVCQLSEVSAFSSAQSLSRVRLFATPRTSARQASLSITNSRSPPKPMSIKLVMPTNHLILCHPLLLLPPIPPSIRVFSNESALRIRWSKYWSFSFNISPFNEHPGLISFRMDWLALTSLLQHHSQNHQFFCAQLSL